MEDDDSPEEFLAHFGVKGMKWGRRKSDSSAPRSSDRKEVDRIQLKRPESLSNDQLKKANNRLQLERTYADLTRQPGAVDKIDKGNTQIKKILAVGGTAAAAYGLATSPAGKAAWKLGKDIINKAR